MTMSHPDVSLGHGALVGTLEHFVEKGKTKNERALAQMALDVYLLVPNHPAVIDWLNRRTLDAVEQLEETDNGPE